MKTTAAWITHFRRNLQEQRIDWTVTPSITPTEKTKIIRSLQAWQLGETSDGSNLIRATEKYVARHNDPTYLEAIKLFIKEEQKHGGNLGQYLDRIGEQRLKRDLGDSLFRKARHLNTSMEMWTITVIIVESFAQLYYKAIHDATHCPLLRQICTDILKDEAHHIKFQLERLCFIIQSRSELLNSIVIQLYQCFFYIIFISVWMGHAKAFKAGGVSFFALLSKSGKKFRFIATRLKEANTRHSISTSLIH